MKLIHRKLFGLGDQHKPEHLGETAEVVTCYECDDDYPLFPGRSHGMAVAESESATFIDTDPEDERARRTRWITVHDTDIIVGGGDMR